MRAALDDHTVLEHQYVVGVTDCAQAMGEDEAGSAFQLQRSDIRSSIDSLLVVGRRDRPRLHATARGDAEQGYAHRDRAALSVPL